MYRNAAISKTHFTHRKWSTGLNMIMNKQQRMAAAAGVAATAVAAVIDTDDVINAVLYTDCAVGRRTGLEKTGLCGGRKSLNC